MAMWREKKKLKREAHWKGKSKNKEHERKKKEWNASWPDNTKNKDGTPYLHRLLPPLISDKTC